MPIVDMPLKELYRYEGRNECPADIDAFWDRSVAEMEALGTGCTVEPAAFQAPGVECFEMYFTGVGGSKIHCRYVRPVRREGRLPAVCVYHGYSGSCGSFSGLLHWAAAGFAAAAMDCRGQGGASEDLTPVRGNTLHGQIIRGLDEDSPDRLYYRSVFLDAAQMARIVMAMDEVDETRVGATGGSQGGALTLACAALTPRLNRAAPMMPFLCDYRRVWEMDLAVDAYSELKEYFRNFDPRHEREEAIFTRLGYIDNKNIAHRIRAEIKMFTGLMDTVCPPSTQFAAYNRISARKSVVIYPDFAHEYYPESDDLCMQFMLEMK